MDITKSSRKARCPRLFQLTKGWLTIFKNLLVIWLVLPGRLAGPLGIQAALSPSQKHLVTTIYDEEVIPKREVGFWSVYDTFATHKVSDETDTNTLHPACLLLKMKLVVRLGNTTLVDVPSSAESQNDTCHLSEEQHFNSEDRVDYTDTPQSIHLTWNDDVDSNVTSSLTLVMSTGPQEGNQEYDQWYWMSRFVLRTPSVIIKLKGLKVFPTPLLFAYTCKGQELTFEAAAKVEGEDKTVFISFHHFEIEAFRENRFYTSLTHLKWDCHVGWPYYHVPIIINIVISILVIVSAADIYRRCRKYNNWIADQRNCLLAEGDTSFANSLDSTL